MGCCTSNLKLDMQRTLDGSIYATKRSRSGSNISDGSTRGSSCGGTTTTQTSNTNTNSSGMGSACSTPQRNRSHTRPICDDFAEQPIIVELDKSCGYHTCSSGASTHSKRQLHCTQDMDMDMDQQQQQQHDHSDLEPAVGNLEWEMFMMQHAQRIMPKTSSPICQRRDATVDVNSRSYHKWRNYLQSTPAHMLHNVSHIPEAIAGHFCPIDFPAFSDLEEMESAAKRFKVDTEAHSSLPQYQRRLQLTHTISTDL